MFSLYFEKKKLLKVIIDVQICCFINIVTFVA